MADLAKVNARGLNVKTVLDYDWCSAEGTGNEGRVSVSTFSTSFQLPMKQSESKPQFQLECFCLKLSCIRFLC